MVDAEGPPEMFAMEEASADYYTAVSSSLYESRVHTTRNSSAAPSHAALDSWSVDLAAVSHIESAAQQAASSRGVRDLPSNQRNSTDSNSSFGDMPTAMAEQVSMPFHLFCISGTELAFNVKSSVVSLPLRCGYGLYWMSLIIENSWLNPGVGKQPTQGQQRSASSVPAQ